MSMNRRCRRCRHYRWMSDFRDHIGDGFLCPSCDPSAHEAAVTADVTAHAATDTYAPTSDSPSISADDVSLFDAMIEADRLDDAA